MGAEIPYMVRVLRLVEDVIEVSAVTSDEAVRKAKRQEDIVTAADAWPKIFDAGQP